jgi:hypothetical protein
MGDIDERIERGAAIYRRAGDDSALLGAALLAFHGALERQIDAELASQSTLGERERGLLEQGRLGWLTRANLAEQFGLLSHAQRDLALEAAKTRLALARGDECDWSADELQTYGRTVALVCGRRELIRQIDQRAERAKATVAHPAPQIWDVPATRRRFPVVRAIVTGVFLLTFAAVLWTIYIQIDGPRLLRAFGALTAPTVAPIPLNDARTPTPPQRRATITGLGGGPGWLHATPSFDSPTRAIKLADGMEVTLREQRQVDTNGLRWQLVEAGGYEGWVPENNLAVNGQNH